MRTKTLVLTCMLLMAALPAFAGGPLIIFDPFTQTPYAYPGVVNVYTDLGDMGPLTNAQADVLSANGYAEWTAVGSATFAAAVAGDFTLVGLPDINGGNAGLVVGAFNGGGIHVMYDDDGSITSGFFGAPPGVLGIASPEWAAGVDLLESWAMVNGAAVSPGDLAPIPGASFGGVFTHEFGHTINLAHTQTNGQVLFFGDPPVPAGCPNPYGFPPFAATETMYPFLDPSPGSVGIDQSTVDLLDDIAALSNVYPAPGWGTGTANISGIIYESDGVTEATGVNVVARNLANPYGDCISALSGDFTQGALGPDGRYAFNGLTPGADYVIYVDQIVAGGFSTTPANPFPGGEEYYNGALESSDVNTDDPCDFSVLNPVTGATLTADVIFNFAIILGDDDFVEVPLPFTFPFCNGEYNSVFIGSNGFLTFGAGNTDFTESETDLINGPPRIAPLWDDLNPTQGGVITAEEVAGNYVITFTNVPEWFATGANTFAVTLRPDGTFAFDYGALSAADGLVGASPGNGIANNPGEIDLSGAPQPIAGANPGDAVYENFTGFDNDLANLSLEWEACPEFELNIEDADPCVVYASLGGAGGGRLISIDPATGAGTDIGPSGLNGMPGLAINSKGEIYGTERISGTLYRIDAATGKAYLVGPTGVSFLDAIAFDENDVLYGIGYDPPAFNLRIIDTQTGASTIVGPTGDIYVGMTFDPSDGQMYASVGGFLPNVPDGIARIDKNTGAATVLGTTGLGGATPDLHFYCGDLYGSKGGGQGVNNLIQIDKNTGAGTVVGPVGFFAVAGLSGFDNPPTLSVSLNPDMLWPPNHKMVEINATATIEDDCGIPTLEILSVESNEPDDGLGDGDTPNDIVIVDSQTLELRSERSGAGDGRVYTVTFQVTDCSGQTATAQATVTVPHDQSGHAVAAFGFTPDGRSVEPGQGEFSLYVPGSATLDVRQVKIETAMIGNHLAHVAPMRSRIRDLNGDREKDLILTYATSAAEAMMQAVEDQGGSPVSLALRYEKLDGSEAWLVSNIFGLSDSPDYEHPEVPDERDLPAFVSGGEGNVNFELGKDLQIRIDVFNVQGRKIRTIMNAELTPGSYSYPWDGITDSGARASNGVYFYRIATPANRVVKKLVLTR